MKKTLFFATLVLLAAMGTLRAETKETNSETQMTTAMADTSRSKINLFSGSWTTSSTPALKVDENYYSNWSATGISQIAFIGTFNGNYKYTHSKFIWDNVADLALGVYWQDLIEKSDENPKLFETRRKNDDKIDLTSTYSQKLKNAWNVNATVNLKTQFMEGFTYASPTDSGSLVSSFMAPGYLTTAIGFECKKDFWNASFSFLTGKTTFLLDEDVVEAGQLYGVDTTNGKRVYAGLGSYAKFYFKKDIAKNLNFYTRIELFYDYRKPGNLDWPTLDDQLANNSITQAFYDEICDKGWLARRAFETDLGWELTLNYRFSSFLSAYFSLNMKYDTDFAGMGRLNRWQIFQNAGLQIYFNWKTPKA